MWRQRRRCEACSRTTLIQGHVKPLSDNHRCRAGEARRAAYSNRRMTVKIDDLTIGEAKQLAAMFGGGTATEKPLHPMIGRRCLIRTYSAGVHIGDVVAVNEMEVHLKNALRLWSWRGGGLSLSAVASNGIVSGRLNCTGEIFLTNAIEIIPTTPEAEATYERFIEDKK